MIDGSPGATSRGERASSGAKAEMQLAERLAWAPRLALWAVPGLLALPALAVVGSPIHGRALAAVLAMVFALAALGLMSLWAPKSRLAGVVGLVTLAVCSWLLQYVSFSGSVYVVAAVMGFGAAPLRTGRLPWRLDPGNARSEAWAPVAFAFMLGLLRFGPGIAWAAWLGIGVCGVAAAALFAKGAGRAAGRGVTVAHASFGGLACAFAVFFVGSTAPAVTWFGALTSHGPRNLNEVALTFDDGPNPDSLPIAAILKEYGVQGTFFEVGKAVAKRPDITQALLADGNIIGNHSYHHDAISYLDPRYPELDDAEHVFGDKLGFCPALFRPPHGTHTPFMSKIVTDRGMTMVTWDVSATDWTETDPEALAEHILAKVQPGSIILLHDGIDGIIPADRSVVIEALPRILDGLRAKGLAPVTLDKLLGAKPYLPPDQC